MPIRIEMEGYGGPEVLRAVERVAVAPGAGEVAVRTAVAGVESGGVAGRIVLVP